MDLKKGCEGVELGLLDQDRVHWLAVVGLQIPWNEESLLIS